MSSTEGVRIRDIRKGDSIRTYNYLELVVHDVKTRHLFTCVEMNTNAFTKRIIFRTSVKQVRVGQDWINVSK